MTIADTLHTDQQAHASWRQLCIVFLIALLAFIALRWQPEAWIESQINAQTKQHGISLSFDQLEVQGFTLQFDHISIRSTQFSTPILFERLSVGPDWGSLFTGTIGVQTRLVWQNQHVSAVLSKQDAIITIQTLNAELDVIALQPLLAKKTPIPLQLAGQASASGTIQLDASNGRPLQGNINIVWNSAAANIPSLNIPLGDYELTLQSDHATSPWQWNLGGGHALILSGKGAMNTSSPRPEAWLINGMIRLQTGKDANKLTAILGSEPKQFSLSGNIANPHFQPI